MLNRCFVLLLSAMLAAPALAGGYGGPYHYGGHYGYRHHGGGDEGVALLAGLVIGGLVGYAVNEDRHYRDNAYRYDHYPRYRYYGHGYRHYGYRYERGREYVRVAPRAQRAIVPADPEFPGHACRMTREYTTNIDIDGEAHEAYGTKCLTSDGSWVLGRPKLVPEFD